MSEDLHERLRYIEDVAEDHPGEALDELQEVTGDLNDELADQQEQAHALIRNEDLAGAAQELSESALVLQRTASLALEVREQVRRRR